MVVVVSNEVFNNENRLDSDIVIFCVTRCNDSVILNFVEGGRGGG